VVLDCVVGVGGGVEMGLQRPQNLWQNLLLAGSAHTFSLLFVCSHSGESGTLVTHLGKVT